MAIVFGHAFQHQRAGSGEIDLVDGLVHRPLDQPLNARVVGQFEKTAHDLQQMLADALGVFRLAEPVADQQRRFMAADQGYQRLGIEEFLLYKLTKIFADPILIARDNSRVLRDKRDRHPAKKRHHGKPVRQRAHHRRFGDRFDPEYPEVRRQKQRDDEGRGSDQQQRERQSLGAFEFSNFIHRLKDRARRGDRAKIVARLPFSGGLGLLRDPVIPRR